MALGVHTLYGCSVADNYRINNKEDYLLGKFVGDHHADEEFDAKMKRVVKRLGQIFGFGNFNYCWSAFQKKPIKRLTAEQKYKRMATLTYNKHKKSVASIINANSLVVDDFLAEEQKKLHKRIEQLKARYKQ
ncbi:MAG: hypothetical protein ACT4OJ_04935 [Bacteroidota bacterium]